MFSMSSIILHYILIKTNLKMNEDQQLANYNENAECDGVIYSLNEESNTACYHSLQIWLKFDYTNFN